MKYFRYKIIEPSGRVSTGVARFPYDNDFSVITHLEQKKNTVIYVKKLSRVVALIVGPFLEGTGPRKITRAQAAEFLGNISVMLRSGLTIAAALRESNDENQTPAFKNAVDSMINDIEMGSTFSETAVRYPHVIPKTVVHLIRIGEETGSMERMLNDGANHLRRIDQIISETKQALIYPSFIFVTLGGGMFFWFYFVVPKILSLFKEMGVALPALTLAILKTSNFLQDNIFTLLGAAVAIGTTAVAAVTRSRQARMAFEQLLLNTPVIKAIINASNLAFITEYFSLLLNAGMDIKKSLRILVEAVQNEVYREKLKKVEETLGLGEGVADSFRAALIFPPFVVRMVSVGEQSGSLPDQLKHIAEEYSKRLSNLVATIGKMIEPLVLVVAGLIFAVIIGGLFMPIYDLIAKVSTK